MLPSQRSRFDLPDDITYLNCGYMSPMADVVLKAGQRGLELKRRPWELRPADFFSRVDDLRGAFAELIGAGADDVAVVASAGFGLEVAARNLPLGPGQHVLVCAEQFPSNIYPWRARANAVGAGVRSASRRPGTSWTQAVLDAIDDDTAVLALPHVHWVDGGLLDLGTLCGVARDRGIAVALDVTQSAGVLPIDVKVLQPDFVVAATYKWLMGPYGLGLLYASKRWQREGAPLENNWINRRGAEDFARLVDYRDEFAAGARRFDVGERSSFALVPAAEAGIRLLLAWGLDNIAATLRGLTDAIVERCAPLGLVAAPADARAPHYLGLRAEGGLPPDLVATLAERRVYVSVRGDAVRVTPHVYNTIDDVDRLVAALQELLPS